MKFIHYLTSIADIEIYPLISLTIFFVFFIVLLWYVFTANKNELVTLKNLPFEQDELNIQCDEK
jgi:cbb3-type cytochrome oxidase subunit 3